MIIGLFPVMANAQADRQTPTCLDSYGSPICVFLHPGIEDEYKPGWSHTLDTLWDVQAMGDGSQRRQVFDNYLDYAILASGSDSVGDLQFDIQVLEDISFIDIYVPPEFTWLAPTREESIWTDITNDYAYIWTSTRNAYDTIAPSWVRVRVGMHDWWGSTMTIEPGTYHIRLFNLRAPEVAGLYFFKIYVDGTSIDVGNYPFTIVKTELNPAFVQVTVRAAFNFEPIVVSGKVTAEGTTPEGRTVKGVAYWGPNDLLAYSEVAGEPGGLYMTVLFGLAAGTYTITAEASGYLPSSSPGGERVSLNPGQSYTVYIVIWDSPDVQVTVWSKHGTGEIPWHNLWQLPYGTNNPAADPDDEGPWRDILLELYDSDNALIAFWASNVLPASKSIPLTTKLIGLHDDIAPHPTATSYYAWLVDNYDLLGNARGYPSTHWDGHVPWDSADYVAGYPKGDYTVEAYVTGYIMDEADAYQRAFSLAGSNAQVQLDLRRTNWIEIAMHMPNDVFLSGDTTVTLTAEDASGNERAAVAFIAEDWMSEDGVINGWDVSDYPGGIVIEGWNAVFPNVGARAAARDINKKDYGLNPTPSTHSAGAVSLAGNPYTVKLYMADMGIPYATGVDDFPKPTGWYSIVGGDPQVSVFMCNSPVTLSFSIANAWVWISLRSVDFEVPAHSRPWTFPGSEIWVEFISTDTGETIDTLDPTIYGLIQDPGTVVANGFRIVGNDDADGVTPFDVDSRVIDGDQKALPGMHEHVGVYYYGTDYCTTTIGGGFPIYRALIDTRSTSLPAGEYTYEAHTHGYVMRRSLPVHIPFAGGADIEADMIQGGQIRVTMDFKHEAVPTDFNGFVAVEVFNANEELVGASIYGQAQPNLFTTSGMGGGYLDYASFADWSVGSIYGYTPSGLPEAAQGAGLDSNYADYPSASFGQRAYTSLQFYGLPPATWADYMALTPSDATRLEVPAGEIAKFDVYGFYWYFGGPVRTWAGGWPTVDTYGGGSAMDAQWDSGLRGSNDIPGWEGSGGGLYTVKVWAFDPMGPNWQFDEGLPVDDWRMYAMGWEMTDINVPWGGSVEQFITMNNMATLRGTIRWFDMYGNLRALPWAQVSASPGPATDQVPAYAAGLGAVGAGASDPSGAFIMWLPAGAHDVSISTSEAPQAWSSSAPTSNAEYTVVVSPGWVGGGDSQLSGSGTPIPELPSFLVPLSLFAALAASVWLLRKRTLNAPILMK